MYHINFNADIRAAFRPEVLCCCFLSYLNFSDCRNVAVVHLNATDLDFGGKARLEYEIADGNKDGKFKINSKTGLITVNNSNNLASHYQLKVSVVRHCSYCVCLRNIDIISS